MTLILWILVGVVLLLIYLDRLGALLLKHRASIEQRQEASTAEAPEKTPDTHH